VELSTRRSPTVATGDVIDPRQRRGVADHPALVIFNELCALSDRTPHTMDLYPYVPPRSTAGAAALTATSLRRGEALVQAAGNIEGGVGRTMTMRRVFAVIRKESTRGIADSETA
jgi:hypothetical protein